MSNYFLSDLHFGHYNPETNRGIITFERSQFKDIYEHDTFLKHMLLDLSKKLGPGDVVWNLGDFGSLGELWTCNLITDTGADCNLILGNHDAHADIPEFEKYFTNVYPYPVWLSNKLVLSHEPVAVYEDTVNVHGHLHGSKLKDINHVNASIHVIGYKPISDKHIANIYSQIPKYNRRFLYEPFAEDYVFIQEKEDVVMDRMGRIDLSASRLLQKMNTEKRKVANDTYQPYAGGL